MEDIKENDVPGTAAMNFVCGAHQINMRNFAAPATELVNFGQTLHHHFLPFSRSSLLLLLYYW